MSTSMSTQLRLSQVILVWTSLLLWTSASAYLTVYLDRPGYYHAGNGVEIMQEPYFNPKSINASIGEQIHFIARFKDFTDLTYGDVRSSLLS